MPKSLSASIVVDLYPTATVGFVALLQSQCDVAKFTPATRVEQLRFGGFNRISLNRVGIRAYCRGGGRSHGRLCAVSFENLRGSQVLPSRLFLEYDFGLQGLTLVAVLYSGGGPDMTTENPFDGREHDAFDPEPFRTTDYAFGVKKPRRTQITQRPNSSSARGMVPACLAMSQMIPVRPNAGAVRQQDRCGVIRNPRRGGFIPIVAHVLGRPA
jgi:hypothetical protein